MSVVRANEYFAILRYTESFYSMGGLGRVRNENNVSTDNLGQNMSDKFKKLSKTGFSMERFAANFSKFSSTTVKNYFLSGRLGNYHQFEVFQRFS